MFRQAAVVNVTDVLSAKFGQDASLKERLLRTSPSYLLEVDGLSRSQPDEYWAAARGKGLNMLGLSLMILRDSYCEAEHLLTGEKNQRFTSRDKSGEGGEKLWRGVVLSNYTTTIEVCKMKDREPFILPTVPGGAPTPRDTTKGPKRPRRRLFAEELPKT